MHIIKNTYILLFLVFWSCQTPKTLDKIASETKEEEPTTKEKKRYINPNTYKFVDANYLCEETGEDIKITLQDSTKWEYFIKYSNENGLDGFFYYASRDGENENDSILMIKNLKCFNIKGITRESYTYIYE